ncbi:MAG: TFIIB-type zinc ribbon-containing protein [Eubacteriales bacterium]|nr:TFIIB-type zinc ribbon-containing protein [Eubacteriales bacterium]
MSDVISIPIPTDDDGYILLQCSYCGEFFKLTGDDIESDQILNVYCPSCGLISENYMTDEVVNLAMTKAQNYAMDLIYDAFKEMERSTRKGPLQIKAGKRPDHEHESPIRSGIEALEITEFPCCKRTAKIKSLLKFTGCRCPFCGVIDFEIE